MKIVESNPPTTSPAGQPAWRMFRKCVRSLGKSVATSGLTTASQIPLPTAKRNMPQKRHWNAAGFPPAANATPAASVKAADAT